MALGVTLTYHRWRVQFGMMDLNEARMAIRCRIIGNGKGLREPLLCADCDNRVISQYEDYACQVLFGGESILTAMDGNDLRIQGLDYTRLRLFHHSLLWRMSVSRLPFYKAVSLGKHEDVIRKMLLEGRPGEVDEYGLFCVAPMFGNQGVGNWMMPPDSAKQLGRRLYRCIIAGLLYCFFVGKTRLPRELTDRFVQKSGTWVIRRDKIERISYLRDCCVHMGEAMKERKLQGHSKL